MRIKYNAPTTITYSFVCALVVAIDQFYVHGLTRALFTVPNALAFNLTDPISYLRLVTHIAGHADWNHLLGNLAYILLLGPMLEENYGSLTMLLMIVVTGFVTGVLNACFFPHPLLGASGVVFMMILLASFANSGQDELPLTFILIVILYLGREILNAFKGDDISQFAHLAGGFCGSLFGFFKPTKSGAALRRDRRALLHTADQRARSPAKSSVSSPSKSSSISTPNTPPSAARKPMQTRNTPQTRQAATPRPSARKQRATMKLPNSPESDS